MRTLRSSRGDTGLQGGVILAASLRLLSTQGGERVSRGLSSMEEEKQALGLRLHRPLSDVLEADSSSRTLQRVPRFSAIKARRELVEACGFADL
jgi:hypothetical protein